MALSKRFTTTAPPPANKILAKYVNAPIAAPANGNTIHTHQGIPAIQDPQHLRIAPIFMYSLFLSESKSRDATALTTLCETDQKIPLVPMRTDGVMNQNRWGHRTDGVRTDANRWGQTKPMGSDSIDLPYK